MFFNTVFTLLPTVLVGIFDQDINSSMSTRVPQIYLKGIRQELFSNERLWIYIAHAVWQSLVCYFTVYLFISDNTFSGGHPYDLSTLSTLMSFAAIFIINIFGTTNWFSWTWINFFSFSLSMTLWIAYFLIYSSQATSATYGQLGLLFTSPTFYAIFLIVLSISLLPRLAIKFFQQMLYPDDTDLLREMQKKTKRVSIETDSATSTFTSSSGSDRFSYLGTGSESAYTQSIHLTDGFEPDKFPPPAPKESPPNNSVQSSPSAQSKKPPSISIRQEDLHKRGSSITKALTFMKNKFLSIEQQPVRPQAIRKGSIIYMSTPDRIGIPNTGFAFSQERGMEEIITPRTSIPDSEGFRKPGTGIMLPGSTLRNISNNIVNVFRFSRPPAEPDQLAQQPRLSLIQKLSPHKEVEDVDDGSKLHLS